MNNMPICANDTENGPCAKPSGHNGDCNHLASYSQLLTGLEDHKPIYDKIHRSPKDTAGKQADSVWGFLQNKVSRSSFVVIPYAIFRENPGIINRNWDHRFSPGYVVTIPPMEYFTENWNEQEIHGLLTLGYNAIVFYTNEQDLLRYPPEEGWSIWNLHDSEEQFLSSWPRYGDGGTVGHYACWYHTDSGFSSGETIASRHHLGIRQDEYADQLEVRHIMAQLAYLLWNSIGATTYLGRETPTYLIDYLDFFGLSNPQLYLENGTMNSMGITTCPFCLRQLNVEEFTASQQQQVGRETAMSNSTELEMMHIIPLQMGEFNHRRYNLGWGHKKCNSAQGGESISESIEAIFGIRLQNLISDIETEHGIRIERDRLRF